MLKKYRIARTGKNDAFFNDRNFLHGREIVAESEEIGAFFVGAFSGSPLFPINRKHQGVYGGHISCFYEVYLEEL
jgi:hypothetical protein